MSKVVTPRKAFRTLQEFGSRFDTENILNSELRVMRTVGYRLNILTPLTYVEAFLELLGALCCVRVRVHVQYNFRSDNPSPSTAGSDVCELDSKTYYNVCIKILEFVYVQRVTIYDHLFHVTRGSSGKSCEEERSTF